MANISNWASGAGAGAEVPLAKGKDLSDQLMIDALGKAATWRTPRQPAWSRRRTKAVLRLSATVMKKS